jgi:integrase
MAKEMPKAVGIIPKKELLQILAKLKEKNRKHYRTIYFLVATGFRVNELLNLKYEDINLRNNLIAITNTKSERIDYFPIYPALRKFIVKEFPNREGKVFDYKNRHSLKFFERFLKNEGFNHYTLHALRKTFISRAINTGVPIQEVMKIVRLRIDNYFKDLDFISKNNL